MFTKEMALAVLICLAKFTGCYLVGLACWAIVWVMIFRRPRRRDTG